MPVRRLLVSVLALVALAGCAQQTPVAPELQQPIEGSSLGSFDPGGEISHGSSRGFYPLELGNHWSFRGSFTIRSGPAGGPLELEYSVNRTVETELTCVEPIDGRDYVIERSTTVDDLGPYLDWVAYRQDGAGLYESDHVGSPPACEAPGPTSATRRADATTEGLRRLPAVEHPEMIEAALRTVRERIEPLGLGPARLALSRHRRGGVLPGEITRLRYPLRVGQRWVIREDPRFVSWVDGIQILRTPVGRIPAWRVRIGSELFSPEDRVVLYVSRLGFLGVSAHLVVRGTDPDGNPEVTVFDDILELEDLDVARGRF